MSTRMLLVAALVQLLLSAVSGVTTHRLRTAANIPSGLAVSRVARARRAPRVIRWVTPTAVLLLVLPLMAAVPGSGQAQAADLGQAARAVRLASLAQPG